MNSRTHHLLAYLLICLASPMGLAIGGETQEKDAVLENAKCTLAHAEQNFLTAPLESVFEWIKLAAPAAQADAEANNRLMALSHLANARVQFARGDAAGAAASVDAAVALAATPASTERAWALGVSLLQNAVKVEDQQGFNAIAAMLRTKVAGKRPGQSAFLTLFDLSMGFRAKDPAAAERDLAEALKRAQAVQDYRQVADRLYRLACEFRNAQNAQVSFVFLHRIRQATPKSSTAWPTYELAARYMREMKELKKSEGLVDEMLALGKNEDVCTSAAYLLQDLCQACCSQKLLFDAERLFNKAETAAQSAKRSTDLELRRGAMHVRLGKLDKAEQIFRAALSADPKNSRLVLALAACLASQGRERDAVAAIRLVVLAPSERFSGALQLEQSRGSSEGIMEVLSDIPADALAKDANLGQQVKVLKLRVLGRDLAAAREEAVHSQEMAELFAVRQQRAATEKNTTGAQRNAARSQNYRQKAGIRSANVQRLENLVKALEQ